MSAPRLAGLLLVLTAASCSIPPETPPIKVVRDEPPLTAEACARLGGLLERAGMLGREMCIIPYADAGRTCQDDSDCEGACWGEPGFFPDARVTGACQPTNSPFGCHSVITQGRAGPRICVD